VKHSGIERLGVLVGALLIAALLVLLVLIGSGLRERLKRAPLSTSTSSARPRSMPLEDVDYRELVGDHTHDSFRARSIVVQQKKLGPLAVNRFSEIQMRHVEIELAGRNSSMKDVSRLVRRAADDQDVGVVTRVRIEGLRVVRRRDNENLFTLHAGVADLNLIERQLILSGQVSLQSATGEQLTATAARWNRHSRRLQVLGPHYFNGEAQAERETTVEYSITPDGRIRPEGTPPRVQGSGHPSQSQSSTLPSPDPESVSE
jgi:hypothetical protein